MNIKQIHGSWTNDLLDRIESGSVEAGISNLIPPEPLQTDGDQAAISHLITTINIAPITTTTSGGAFTPQDLRSEAAGVIADHTSYFNLDEDGLGRNLAGTIGERPELARAVYAQLDGGDRVQVARAMIDRMSNDDLRDAVWSQDGRALLLDINRWVANNSLTGEGRANAVSDQGLRERIGVALTRTDDVVLVATRTPVGQATSEPRELQGSEIPPNSNNEIRWELPASGVGYETYNRNDTRKNYNYSLNSANPKQRPRMPDQIGTRNTIERIQTLAREWHAQHPDRPLQVGDISLPGGVNTPDHGTHENGRNVDVRPLRNDRNSNAAARLTYNSPAYDQELTKEFIKLTVARNPETTFYFNDPKIYNDPEFKGIVTSSDRSHDNHLHIMFPENQ